ncbi:PREDICTED: sodium-coupled monocarboxylate transporter 1-like [Nicrophorus vespilloides]|uniref:Sodium-coupled monocarboxylate transporter 1-like n=1 Tax=Nicrophorus vespilloides TaxID=110193 RepID=A0ABM1M3D9_NICVS|nr:PREDICTED: sodium-coupled monocarboxylate transporter 1-like [Nicrophorus vespilloides]
MEMFNITEDDFESTTLKAGKAMMKVAFSWYDYTLFSMMLILSALIGVYFGFFGKKKQTNATEYLMGGKEMKPLPIAMSLVASHVSGIALLGVPADVYRFGSNYWMSCLAIIPPSIITCLVYLPVFYNLQLTSTYEYLKLRFDTKIRVLASFLYAFGILIYLPIVIYVPAMALAQATEINIHLITPLICGVCIFYTTIGGLKAVVWTDMLQFSITIGAMIAVLYLGTVESGGIASVFQKASSGQLLDIDFDSNPTKRDTFWAMMIGWSFSNISYLAISQGCIQKFLSVPTFNDAKKTVYYYIIGMMVIKTSTVLTGLIMYAKYYDCDPITAGSIDKPDQLLPYYVMDVAAKIPGLPGLFIAGVFCAALSTLSATMNCIAGTIYEDFVARYMPKDITQKKVSNILKLNVVIIGVVATSLVFVVEHMGTLLPLTVSISSISTGPLLGMFTLGILFPKANSKGALAGAIASLAFSIWIILGSYLYRAWGIVKFIPKPASIDGCDFEVPNFTPINATLIEQQSEEVFVMFRITYYYYTIMTTSVALIVGYGVSLLTRTGDEEPVDRRLLSPIIHRFLDKNEDEEKGKYHSIDKALHIVALSNNKNGLKS